MTLLIATVMLGIAGFGAQAAAAADADLVALARGKFSNLTTAELALLKFVGSDSSEPEGFAVAGPSANPDDPTNDPAHADRWGKGREVRAELIRWLCVDSRAKALIDPQGIRLLGARITGGLNLSYVSVPFPIAMHKCLIADRLMLNSVQIPALDLAGSHTGPIVASGMHAGELLMVGPGFEASGEVNLDNSKISGALSFFAGHFRGSESSLNYLSVKQNLAISVTYSQIGGQVILCCGFEADGAVFVGGSTIAGDMYSGNARFINPNNVAFDAEAATIAGDVGLGKFGIFGGSEYHGLVRLMTTRIGSVLFADSVKFIGGGLTLEGASIKGAIAITHSEFRDGAILDLSGATTSGLADDTESWPPPGKLLLDGFTYDGFASGKSDAQHRLLWLSLQPEFHPQPYRQLAKVLREGGDEAGATEVLVVAEDRRYASYGRAGALLGIFLKATIGYGHKPLRTIGWSLLAILVPTKYVI